MSGDNEVRAVSDPVGLITSLVAAAEPALTAGQVREVVTAVAGGRAKSRRLALALAGRPGVLADGRSPAPRAVAAAVRRAAPRQAHQRQVAWALEEHPALLDGEAHLAPLRAIPRLVEMLHDAGIAGIVRPSCGHCGRAVRIDKPLGGVRACRSCIAKSRAEQCSQCGAVRDPVTRENGMPVCANCFITAPENLEACVGCGRVRKVERRTPDGPLCSRCPGLKTTACSVCGQVTPCGTSRTTGLPCCPACRHRRAACSSCGRRDVIAAGTIASPLCGGCAPPPPWAGCPVCSGPDHPAPGQCARCLVNTRLDKLMGPDAGLLPPGLQALRREIATAEHAVTAMRWIAKPSIAPVLSGLADGGIPLTHQALDQLPQRPALAHLRQALVATGALPWRDEETTRLEASLGRLLDSQPGAERRRLLHRYLIWHLVRRTRTRNNGKPMSRQQSLLIRRLARGATAFLDWLGSRGLTLGDCRQADLDYWPDSGQATYRDEAGRLIRWAHAARITACYLPAAARWNGPAALLDHEDRWGTARRLLHDDSIRPEDRLAGLLVLLYAQNMTAISCMTTGQVQADDHAVRLCLGRVPVQLPEPLASVARAVAANRKGHAAIGATRPSPWLFPGGQPGRPISTARLTTRIEALGISPRQARSTALLQLAAEIPAAILARTLGVSTDVAVIWQRLSAGDWAAYAADVSRRSSPKEGHPR